MTYSDESEPNMLGGLGSYKLLHQLTNGFLIISGIKWKFSSTCKFRQKTTRKLYEIALPTPVGRRTAALEPVRAWPLLLLFEFHMQAVRKEK